MQPNYHRREESTSRSPLYNNLRMPNEQPKAAKKPRRRRLSILVIAFILLFSWYSSLWMDQQEVIAQKQQELNELKQAVTKANQLQSELNYKVKRLQDRDYIAEVARRDYFLARPGEVIFKVPNN
jgi:cell division protein DivIC